MKHRKTTAVIAFLAALSMTVTPLTVGAEEVTTPNVTDTSDKSASEKTDAETSSEPVLTTGSEQDDDNSEQFIRELTYLTIKGYAVKHYKEVNEKDAADSEIEVSEDEKTAVITLKDEGGAVLDVYTIDLETGTGTNQKGDAVDLTKYTQETFISALCVKAQLHYLSINLVFPEKAPYIISEDGKTITITLTDADGKVLDVYTIDMETEIGTNQNGDTVNLNDSESSNEDSTGEDTDDDSSAVDEKFAEMVLTGYVKQHYQDSTGKSAADASVEMSKDQKTAVVTLKDESGAVLDIYTIDLDAGTGTNQKGETVDLTGYSQNTILTIFTLKAESYYAEKNGAEAADSASTVSEDGKTVTITLKDAEGKVLDIYTVDFDSETGTDQNGNAVNLKDYPKLDDPDTSGEVPDDPVSQLNELFESIMKTYSRYAEMEYKEKTGSTDVTASSTISPENSNIIITLKNTEGKVLDIYTVDSQTGDTVNQKGEKIDLEIYALHDQAEVFAGYAEQDFEAKNGKKAASHSCQISEDRATIMISLLDDAKKVLDVYAVNVETGEATNQKGDKIDLTYYAPGIKDDEFFMPQEYIMDVAAKFYTKQTGNKTTGCSSSLDSEAGTMKITIYGDEGKALETYTIDARTGLGKDSKGNAVDLSVYKDYKPFSEADYFIPENIIDEAAMDYYKLQTGKEAAGTSMWTDYSVPEMEITLYSYEDDVLAVYTIDPSTGIGTDANGKAVDLAAYAASHEVIDRNAEEDNPYENAYFVPTNEMLRFAKMEYTKNTGKEADNTGYSFDNDQLTGDIELYDEDANLLEKYSIDLRTGKGTDSKGNAVDLSAYIIYEDDPEFYAPLSELAEWAAVDYQKLTGKDVHCGGWEISDDKSVLTVYLYDEEGEEVAVYLIDPHTGKGKMDTGAAVDLPQTGNNAVGYLAVAAGAFSLIAAGWFTVMKSGVLRKKEEK